LKLFNRTREGDELKAPTDPDPQTSTDSGVPPLSGLERLAVGVIALGGAAVGGFGFYASFDSVSAKAAGWGFTEPWILPTAIDSAIPVFTGAYLLLIRTDMRLWWARLVPWVLSLITCALNVASGNTLGSKLAHGAMSLLWVGVSEIAAHVYAVRIGAATGRRRKMDKVRWARWFLAPFPTFLLWRRMKLWELTSYDTVLKLEQERLVYQAKLRGRFGRAWRRKAPVAALLPLQLVSAGVPLAETAAAGLRAAGIDPTGIFAEQAETVEVEALEAPAPAAAPALPPAAAPAPAPAAVAPAAVPKPRTVTATVPQQPARAETAPVDVPRGEETTAPSTEEELYNVVVAALQAGEIERFGKGGDLTGSEIGRTLCQTPQNGRKVRNRLLTRYAACLSDQGVPVPENFTVEDLATTANV
jgi:hypothetical protein